MPLQPGEPAPWFTARTASNPEFVFDTAAGRYVLMLFLPVEAEPRGAALKALAANQRLFDDAKATCLVVVRDPETAAGTRDLTGLRWMIDLDGAVSRRFGAQAAQWLLLDPTLRVIGSAGMEQTGKVLNAVAQLPPPAAHAGVPLHAPVLTLPRVFEPEFCEALIAFHQAGAAEFTGVMRDQGDRTVLVMDDLKKRRDVLVTVPELQAAIRERLERRLFPMIKLALGFSVTRIERYLIGCYDEADGGVFHPHRDSTTQGTAHRRFACSINLNDDFEGGSLRFGEYGPATYRPPPGGAVVFSCALLHEATRVTRGRRYAFLPFFFDEAGAAQKAAYEARVAEAAS
jgi:predicted 2-oxoglutarate/Fe(II)-dependent dioxygenase YbiX/peroxiredoxin